MTECTISVAQVPPRDRTAAWHDAVCATYVPLEFVIDDPEQFSGVIRADDVGDIGVAVIKAMPHRAVRTKKLCQAMSSPEYYKVSMPLAGTATIAQDDRLAVLGNGDMAFYSTCRPYDLLDASGAMLVLRLPESALELPPSLTRRMSARRISGKTGVGALFAPMFRQLAGDVGGLNAKQPQRVADTIREVLYTILAEATATEGLVPQDPVTVMRARALAVIEEHLSDPWLGPETVAAACFISTGYLHKLFRGEDLTVSALIRTKRLARCRRALLNPANRERSVSAIGAEWGLLDAAHFSRVFKAEFGMSPSDFRRTANEPVSS